MTVVADSAPVAAPAASQTAGAARRASRASERKLGNVAVLIIYIVFLMLPIYWLLNMSLKTNAEILGDISFWPRQPTLANFATILTDPTWYMGYVNSLIYVLLNTAISLTVALPAAYAFSRYTFLGDKHLFFWLLTNRMAPPAVFALPFFQLYSSVGLFDTHIAVALAHCLFNVPLAVWILEGFMRGVPKEIDETAFIDGYSWPRFFVRIFMPLISSGIGVAAFFCFMFSWVELLLSRTLTSIDAKPIAATMTRTVSASGLDWGVLAAAGILTIVPGALVVFFVRNYIAKGFALGEGLMAVTLPQSEKGSRIASNLLLGAAVVIGGLWLTGSTGAVFGGLDLTQTLIEGSWMAWNGAGALFFVVIALALLAMIFWGALAPEAPRRGILGLETTPGDRLFLTLLGSAFIQLFWLFFFGAPLWGSLSIALLYGAAVFRWV